MTKHPPIVPRVTEQHWEAVPVESDDDRHRNGRQGANDVMLVLGVAVVVLGLVIVSRGMLPSQPGAHIVSREHAAVMPVERVGPARNERLAAETSPTESVPSTPATRTTLSGATGLLGPCPLPFDLDHDLGQDLAAMAQQGRRINQERPAGFYGPADKQDVPAKDRAIASAVATLKHQVPRELDTRVAASPQATWRTRAEDPGSREPC